MGHPQRLRPYAAAGGKADFRVAVNVLSQEKPAELLNVADENFRHPLTQRLPGCRRFR
jgi:uncharacterized protein YukJ